MNIQDLMMQANKMQKELENAQKEIELMEFKGKSQLVEVIMAGNRNVKKIIIPKELLTDSESVELLEDMIVLAFNDALSQIDVVTEEKMGKHTKALKGII